MTNSAVLPPFPGEADLELVPDKLRRAEADSRAEFKHTEDHPRYRKGFRYIPCIAYPQLPCVLYQRCEPPPYRAGLNELDRSPKALIRDSDDAVTTTAGYVSARANVFMSSGSWYWEVDVVHASLDPEGDTAAVRVGISRREMSCEGPVGADVYSYGVQNLRGSALHGGRPKPFMEPFGSGNVIGFHLSIPPQSSKPTVRNRYPIKFKDRIYYEVIDYKQPKAMRELLLPGKLMPPTQEEVIDGSFIDIYKNGNFQGRLASNLRNFLPPWSQFDPGHKISPCDDGECGYFPTISVFEGGQARFNFGPNFRKTDHPGQPLFKRFDEHIAEDIIYDILDEVELEQYGAAASSERLQSVPVEKEETNQ